MAIYIAFLRAVNVGGTGKLPMSELKAMCEAEGFLKVRTYIASGNVIFESKQTEAQVKAVLEKRLAEYAGKPVGVLVRTPKQLTAVLAANPFPEAAPNRTVAIFLDTAPPSNAIEEVKGKKDEELRLGSREIYVHYGSGMADSKLKIPAAREGTARNINTIAKMIELAETM